jgi:flagellar biosynthesis protein FlhF
MDCYRIGATDQLRTYAQIMRLPCEIVLRQTDLAKALARHHDKDVVIIDTAGKSPYDEAHVQELQSWFAPCPAIEPHLVLAATTKKEDLQTIITAYAPLAASSLILTKLDETRAYAGLCQQVVASMLPVSYLSTGQRVPEDFLVASKDFLDTLFKEGWTAATPLLAAKYQMHDDVREK